MEKRAETESKKINKITNLVAYITILIFIILQVNIVQSIREKIISFVIMVLFVILWRFWLPKIENSKFYLNLFILVETILILTPLILNINWGIFPYIFFVLSVFSLMELSFQNGIIWILIFSIISFFVFSYQLGVYQGILFGLLYGAGSLFFGGFGYALSIVIESKRKQEDLVNELSEANKKLKEYASKVEQLTLIEERNRLSREMHDSLGHHLVSASLLLEIVKRMIKENPDEAYKIIETIKKEISESLDELRNVVKTLRKPYEFDIPLEESIKNLINNFSKIENIKLDFEMDEDIKDLTFDYKITIFRVCQEALTNIEKHSHATEAKISLKKINNEIVLIIEDNGVGFPKNIKDDSFGLKGIKERAKILGGRVSFENREEGGAKIIFSLPLIQGGNSP
ncbi:MAG: sensor histidine kinase [Caldisericia bacterium]|jgi:signal transduction histidine kinase|nr:sensor histidine kinase [Caldisericia bacterium]